MCCVLRLKSASAFEVQDEGIYSFVSVKAFGDLVIAANSLSKVSQELGCCNIKILLGQHLNPLWRALSPPIEMEIIQHRESFVPSAYDIRKNGLLKGIQSYQSLRQALCSRQSLKGETLVFDKMGLRERLLSRGLRASARLPNAGNIYLGYAGFWGLGGLPTPCHRLISAGYGKGLAIFPSARMQERVVPISLVERALQQASKFGIPAEVVLIDGEMPEHKARFPDAKILPRDFNLLKDAMQSYTHVISADSLTAHLAEYVGKPVFVLSPVRKEYWLPHSSYIHRRWALFNGPVMPENCSLVDFMLL